MRRGERGYEALRHLKGGSRVHDPQALKLKLKGQASYLWTPLEHTTIRNGSGLA